MLNQGAVLEVTGLMNIPAIDPVPSIPICPSEMFGKH